MAERDPNPNSPALLSTLGEEIVRIVAPVSLCMLIVVLLVTTLSSPDTPNLRSIATMAYSESDTDTIWSKLSGALLNSLAFVATITLLTFLLVLLFYFRLTGFLRLYMAFSSFVVLSFLGGDLWLLLLDHFRLPLDAVTFLFLLVNLSVVGVLAVFLAKGPILVTQGYLVTIGVLVAYWFTMLPEWTTWALLVAMAVYDLAAVLLPGGPLRLLVELAISRDEEIPALVYEARPVEARPESGRRLWRENRASWADPSSDSAGRRDFGSNPTLGEVLPETRLVVTDEARVPLISHQVERGRGEEEGVEGIGLGSSGAIKLGLGDFIFYSVLVGRAALYDFMAVYACYLAIIAGLGITLLLLAFYRKALPALPVSVMLGVLFYLLTRVLLEVFVVQCSINLLMF
ncbi:presenilin-like protein isoform X1 [Iris pallida]|uniref:Presenilin n=1 Tax=Iris pallida TaxID=29817 RepID=A0AAX6DUU8_IRIPA|nr:presenilin-like protein isoform X1 [Iris pallida]